MDYRRLGGSTLEIPALILGTATFGGGNDFFRKWGETDVKEATDLVDVALDAGCTMFDTADVYSAGLSEEILGKAVSGRRQNLLIATKIGMAMGSGPDDIGTSASRIVSACEASLKRLGTDYIDLYQLHAFDAQTPVEEMLLGMESLLSSGKIRQFGVSNYSGWHLMKMLGIADREKQPRPVSHQAYYSLADREFEWELMPLGLDQNVSTLVWSPLAGAKLTGKIGRHKQPPSGSRATTDASVATDSTKLYGITDVLETLSRESGLSIPKIALAWLLSRPTIAGIVIGARNVAQLRDNLGAADVTLDPHHIQQLDKASARRPIYPYWHQEITYASRNPSPVPMLVTA